MVSTKLQHSYQDKLVTTTGRGYISTLFCLSFWPADNFSKFFFVVDLLNNLQVASHHSWDKSRMAEFFFEWFSNSSWTSFSQYEVTRVFRSCEYYVLGLPNSFRNHCTYHFFFYSDFGSPHTHEKLGHEEIPSYARLVCWYNPYSAFSLTRNRFSDDFPRAKNQENWMPNA